LSADEYDTVTGFNTDSIETESGSDEDVYVDRLTDNEDDIRDLELLKKNTPSPADKVILKFLAIADLIIFCGIGLYVIFTGGGNAYSSIKGESVFGVNDLFFNPAYVLSSLNVTEKQTDFPEGMMNKFRTLYSVNNDTCAWLKSVDSSIDFVVMQAADNDKYLRKDFYLDYSIRGTVFMDYRNTVGRDRNSLSKNTVLYGHNFSVGSQMIFEDTQKYADLEYYKEHPIILMDTLYNSYKWKVIAAFECYPVEPGPDEFFYYWATDFTDDNTPGFVNEVLRRSFVVNPSVDVLPTDKFLTLSTCLHMPTKNGEVVGRFVTVCRLVRDGESAAVDTSLAYSNENRRMPGIWYEYNNITNPYTDTPVWDAFQ